MHVTMNSRWLRLWLQTGSIHLLAFVGITPDPFIGGAMTVLRHSD